MRVGDEGGIGPELASHLVSFFPRDYVDIMVSRIGR